MCHIVHLIIGAALLISVGCGTYDARFAYEPAPAETRLTETGQPEAEPVGRMLTSIIGVRRNDPNIDHPNTVQVRLRIENDGPQTIRINPTSLQLLTGNLREFGSPSTEPSGAVDVPTGERASLDAYFPFPPETNSENLNLSGLNLKLDMRIGERTEQRSVNFHRLEYRYEPRYRSRYKYGLGIWYCD